MGSIKIKLNNGAIEVLMAELQPNEMGAIYMMGFGREMPDSVTKYHLTKIIAVLCEKLGWIETDEHKNSTPQTEHISDEICRDLDSPSLGGLEKNSIHEPDKNDKKLLENSFVISEVYTQNQAEVKTDLDQHFGEVPLNVGCEAEWASEDDSENLSEIDFEASEHDLSHEEMINSSAEIDVVENLPINIKKEDVAKETFFQTSEEDKKKEHRANVKSIKNPKKVSASPRIKSSPKVVKDCGFEQCKYTSQDNSNMKRHKKRHGHFKQTELEQGQASAKVPVKVEAIQGNCDFPTTPSIAAASAIIECEEGIVKGLEISNKIETPSKQQHLIKTAQYAVPHFVGKKKKEEEKETFFQMSEEDTRKEHRGNVKSMVGLENPKKVSASPGIESSPNVGKDCGFEQCEYTSQFTSNVKRHKKRHGHFKQTELEQGQASAKVPVKVEAIQGNCDFPTTPSIAAASAIIECEEGIVKGLEISNKIETPSKQQHLIKTAQYAVPNFVGKKKKEVLLRCPVCNWAMRGSNLYRHVSIKHPKVDISTLYPERIEPNGASKGNIKPVLPRRAKTELRKKPRLTVEKDKANSTVHSLCSKCNLYIHSSNTARHWRMKHTEEVYSPSKMKQNGRGYVSKARKLRQSTK